MVGAEHAVGAKVQHLDAWSGNEVDLDYVLRDPASVVGVVEAAGLVDVEWYVRGPLTTIKGETTRRLYVVDRSA